MATAKKSPKQTQAQKEQAAITRKGPRKLKQPTYQRFKFSKRIKHNQKLSSGWKLFVNSLTPLKQNWKLFGGILLVYGLLTLVFVKGLSGGTNLTELKASLDSTFTSSGDQLSNSFALFGILLGSSTGGDQVASLYQSGLLTMIVLVSVWTLRQLQGDPSSQKLRVKDTFYKSMRPLVPFVLVLFVMGLQLVPLLVGAGLYSTIVNNGLAVGLLEQLAWLGAFFLLALWSLYMLTPTVIALMIVTLPDMQPVQSIRISRQLVKYRRWTVLRKILFLPLILFIVLLLIMLPLIIWLTPAAQWAFFALSLAAAPVAVSYIYGLYKELM